MERENLISVIVPIYKVEKYLDKCVQSLVTQTYSNLEIILVDDGSPDNCPDICDRWAKKDSRIKVLHKQNGGLSDARNAGLEIAAGEYIGFVDSDDYICENMYELLLKNLCKTNADLAICNYRLLNEEGKKLESCSPIRNELLTREKALQKLEQDYWWYYVTAWNKLYTRKSLENVKFPVGKIHEDQFVVHRVFYNCRSVVTIADELYLYMQHGQSIMSKSSAIRHLDAIDAICDRYEFYKKKGEEKLCIGTISVLEHEYNHFRNNACLQALKGDRTKIAKVDKEFRQIFFSRSENRTIINYFMYEFPDAHFAYERIKCKVRFRTRLHVLKTLVQYNIDQRKYPAILLDTPTHINLGDHAIVLAERQVLAQCGIRSYELTAPQINGREAKYAAVTPKNQYILVQGGGFLGSLWPNEEERFRRIVQAFNKQKIIVFPQTVTFDTTTPEGRKYLEESQRIYASHPDLTIFVREKRSYAFMQQYFPTVRCLLVPDIVTLLHVPDTAQTRRGVLFCMRRDLEKALDDAAQQEILTAVKTQYPDEAIEFTDTVIDHDVMPENREEEVNKKLVQFSGARLIVTDRLHGMVFAALTNTPCIAMSNSNGKVKAVYEWIKGNDYIRFANSVEEFKQQLQTLDVSRQYTYDRKLAEHEFEPLFEEIRKLQK